MTTNNGAIGGLVVESGWYAACGEEAHHYPCARDAREAREACAADMCSLEGVAEVGHVHVRAWRRAHVTHADGSVTVDDTTHDEGLEAVDMRALRGRMARAH